MARNLPFEGEVLRRALGPLDLGEIGTEPVRGRRLGELLTGGKSCTGFVGWVGACGDVNFDTYTAGCFNLDGVIGAGVEVEFMGGCAGLGVDGVNDKEGAVVVFVSERLDSAAFSVIGVITDVE
jgi:hypothetical protein